MLFCLFLLLILAAGRVLALQLSRSGKAEAVIVADESASVQEINAAKELAGYLEKICGGRFEISGRPGDGVNIYIGQTSSVKALLPEFDWQSLKWDGILIKSDVSSLILAGDRPRGTIYAVYTFLEEYLGVRYLTAFDEIVPQNSDIVISDDICRLHKPDFFSREAYYKMNKDNPAHALKLKLNGHFNEIPAEWGGHCELIGFGHTYGGMLLREEDYFAEHPEWYALRDGRRVPTQPCLSNTEMLDKVAENIIKELDAREAPQMISVTQNDNEQPCQCEKCQAMVKEFGAESGMLVNALNYLYDKIKYKYPDIMLETFAYQYSVPAPSNIKPCKNAIVRLCDIENNFGEPIEEKSGRKPYTVLENCRIFPYADQQTVNGDFYKNLEAWGKTADNLFVWNYTVNFNNYYIIHPNFHILKQDILSYRKNNVCAVFEQGDCFNLAPAFNALKSYLLGHLLWEPDADDDAIIRDFMRHYYGPCWKYLYEVICGCERLIRSRHIFLSTYMNDVSWMNTEEMIYFFRLFRLAYDTAEGVYKDRIKNELMFFQTGWFVADAETRKIVADSGYLLISDEKEFAKAIFEYGNASDNAFYSESKSIDISPYAQDRPIALTDEGYTVNAEDFLLRRKCDCLIEDKSAAHGKALKVLASNDERIAVRNVTGLLNSFCEKGIKKLAIGIVCRSEKPLEESAAVLQIELWDPLAGGPLFKKILKGKDISAEYSVIELGERTVWLSKGCGLYIHSYKADNIYIDRVIITEID